MKERPILFSGLMVKAILDGRKTQTRRLVTSEHVEDAAVWADCGDGRWESGIASGAPGSFGHGEYVRCPYGVVGDLLWVREAHATVTRNNYPWESAGIITKGGGSVAYRSSVDRPDAFTWRPSIFMPRWASRITLEITEVRVQRLQEISENDARAEGCLGVHGAFGQMIPGPPLTAREDFERLWDRINGKRAPWASNPWVWALTFRRVS